MKNKTSIVLVMLFLLTACSGTSSFSDSSDIDFNQDIAVIAQGIDRFERNSQNATDMANQGGDAYAGIVAENKAALDEVDLATDVFLSHINQASSRLPKEDTAESPSEAKLIAWANGYKSWVYYQRQAQTIGEKCLASELEFTVCSITNLPDVLEFERLSQVDLKNAVAGIQEWRKSLGYE
jgi:hypothetical protein